MWKIILVDDEKIIRETMSRVIAWEEMGIELVGVCQNGLEAFDMIVDESPDIVVTDICMPGFSGLELVEKVRSAQMNIEFVILSGYSEFDYAQKAMAYGIRHYLLKPCEKDQIEDVMRQVVLNCEKKRQAKEIEESLSFQEQVLRVMREMGASTATENECCREKSLHAFREKIIVSSSGDLSLAKASVVQFLLSFWQTAEGVSQLSWMNLLFEVNAASSINDLLELAAQGVLQVRNSPNTEGKYKEYIRKCIAYTNEHYGDASLTLKWISENVLYMNVDYVSKQFVQQTGEKYSTYLGKIRIKNAQRLLRDGEKVNSVAQQVGCGNNPQYFSQMFKKYTGMSPKNWQLQNENS